MKAAVAGLNKL